MNSAMYPPKLSTPARPRTAPTKHINQEIFLNILCSLNKGAYDISLVNRTNMDIAIKQYNDLVNLGIVGGDKI